MLVVEFAQAPVQVLLPGGLSADQLAPQQASGQSAGQVAQDAGVDLTPALEPARPDGHRAGTPAHGAIEPQVGFDGRLPARVEDAAHGEAGYRHAVSAREADSQPMRC